MNPADVLGYVAGTLSTFSLVPQIVRVVRLRSARELSLPFTALFLVGVLLWMVYGIVFRLPPVIFWNAVSAALMAGLLFAKLRLERKRSKD